MQVGGPLLALTSLILVVIAVAFSPVRPDPAAVASSRTSQSSFAPLLSAPAPTTTTPSAFGPLAAPPTFTPAPPPVFPRALTPLAPTPDPDVLQMEQLDALRYQVQLASRAMRAKQEWQRYSTPSPLYKTSPSAYANPEL